MPVRKVKTPSGKVGYKYGSVGKTYPTKTQAERQGRAIRISQIKAGKRPK